MKLRPAKFVYIHFKQSLVGTYYFLPAHGNVMAAANKSGDVGWYGESFANSNVTFKSRFTKYPVDPILNFIFGANKDIFQDRVNRIFCKP
jgi:hypothetical protein